MCSPINYVPQNFSANKFSVGILKANGEGYGRRPMANATAERGRRRMQYLAGLQRNTECYVLWIRDSTLFVPNKGGFTADSDKALRFSDANMARLAVAPSASTRDSIVILPVNE